jgi:AbrB family looped-hinge helix DNA binding protein
MGEEEKRGHVYGTVKVGDRGQVVIPAQARQELDIKPGDVLLVMTGKYKRGLSMVKADAIREFANKLLIGLEETDQDK